MNSLVQGYYSTLPDENREFRCKFDPNYEGFLSLPNDSPPSVDESVVSYELLSNWSSSSSSTSPTVDYGEESKYADYSDEVLKFISQMLMEEDDLENKPCMLRECLALQATEKSLYDVLTNNDSPSNGSVIDSDNNNRSYSDLFNSNFADPDSLSNSDVFGSDFGLSNSDVFGSNSGQDSLSIEGNGGGGRDRKNRIRDESREQRSSKQFATSEITESEESLKLYDEVLLCSTSDRNMVCGSIAADQKMSRGGSKSNRGRAKGGNKKQTMMVKEVVDLRGLLMQCAQAVANFDNNTASTVLLRIRNHSSPIGDGTERLAHYFANALEARLSGTGTSLYSAISSVQMSAARLLKAHQLYLTVCPFKKMYNLLANKTIRKLAAGATTLHIIDFGILYGFQWPCLIHILSERPGGPPKLRITGIEFPQPGFRPAQRVEDTGHRLAKYCDRFGVPFEYKAIATKWETIKVEDIGIREDEVVVVNSQYRLHNVPDETVTDTTMTTNCPRDEVLKLIRKLNPEMFIDGVVNGTYNTPFFITRFREALFHFSAQFDMYEAAVKGIVGGGEEEDRMLFEENVFGRDAMNIIACEGWERVDRPETYKQWQGRHVRAGFRQVDLDEEIVKYVREKVKREYHKDFSVDEDGKWMLHGWKGRVLHGISCWRPA